MKKIFCILAALMCIIACATAQVKQEGKTFVQQKTERKVKAQEIEKTQYTYKDTKGNEYPIMINKKTGSCFVTKVSQKTGNEYKQYMEEEICTTISKEYGIQYTPRKKQSKTTE